VIFTCIKSFDKVPYLFRIKALNNLTIKRAYLNIIKDIYDMSIENIIVNLEKLKAFSLKSETR
jgi:hypothetical protein